MVAVRNGVYFQTQYFLDHVKEGSPKGTLCSPCIHAVAIKCLDTGRQQKLVGRDKG